MCFPVRLLRAIEPPDPQRRQARALPSTAITHTLTVSPTGSGFGSVSAGSGVISGCSSSGGTCTGGYDEGSTVPLTDPATRLARAMQGSDSADWPISSTVSEVQAGASRNAAAAPSRLLALVRRSHLTNSKPGVESCWDRTKGVADRVVVLHTPGDRKASVCDSGRGTGMPALSR